VSATNYFTAWTDDIKFVLDQLEKVNILGCIRPSSRESSI